MRIALGLEYLGTNFYGWQAQTNLPTVQGCLEEALSKIADHPVRVFCAGRTDAGVHALGQVVHFDTEITRNLRAWVHGTNTHLPPHIAVKWAEEVDSNFHARFSAEFRAYNYIIYNNPIRSAILASKTTWFYPELDIEPMQKGAQFLLGEQDFSSFRSAQCESKTPMRNVHHIQVYRKKDIVVVEIQANAFLHHMVRNIVGALIKVGTEKCNPEWIQDLLALKDRTKAAETAAPNGLYLSRVGYPKEFDIPDFGVISLHF